MQYSTASKYLFELKAQADKLKLSLFELGVGSGTYTLIIFCPRTHFQYITIRECLVSHAST